MKVIICIFLTFFLGKSCSDCTEKDIESVEISYSATSRGYYQYIVVTNHKALITEDRKAIEKPREIVISDADWKELIENLKAIDLEEIPNFKDPTQKRFYDGAAIGQFKIKYKDKSYEAKSFDHEIPPVEIKKIVDLVVSFGKTNEE